MPQTRLPRIVEDPSPQATVEMWTRKLMTAANSGDLAGFAQVFANILATCELGQVKGILQQRESAGMTVLMHAASGRLSARDGATAIDATRESTMEAGLSEEVRFSEAGRVLTFRMALQCLKSILTEEQVDEELMAVDSEGLSLLTHAAFAGHVVFKEVLAATLDEIGDVKMHDLLKKSSTPEHLPGFASAAFKKLKDPCGWASFRAFRASLGEIMPVEALVIYMNIVSDKPEDVALPWLVATAVAVFFFSWALGGCNRGLRCGFSVLLSSATFVLWAAAMNSSVRLSFGWSESASALLVSATFLATWFFIELRGEPNDKRSPRLVRCCRRRYVSLNEPRLSHVAPGAPYSTRGGSTTKAVTDATTALRPAKTIGEAGLVALRGSQEGERKVPETG